MRRSSNPMSPATAGDCSASPCCWPGTTRTPRTWSRWRCCGWPPVPAARQNPQGYARTILVNLARDRWRVRRRRQPETLVADAARLPCGAARDNAAAVLDRQALLCACRLLPTAQRAVLVLRFWEDRSIEETAAVLGCTPGTVKSHTHRALRRLRAVLQEASDEAMPPVPLVLARRLAGHGWGPFPGSGGSTVLTDHDVTEELAAAFHDQADPVTRTALDPAGIFPRGARARRRRAAIRVAAAGAAATALAVAVTVANLVPVPRPVRARRPGRPACCSMRP